MMSQPKSTLHRAHQALSAAAQQYPNAWALADAMRLDNGKPGMPRWPSWCFLPLGGWYAVVANQRHRGGTITDLASILDVSRLAALGTWRMTQGIYRVQPELFTQLVQTGPDTSAPCEVLYTLPEWCVYLDTPGLHWGGKPLHGAWVHLEHDANDCHPELRLIADTDTGLIPAMLPLGAWSLDEALAKASTQAGDAAQSLRQDIAPLLSLVLHLCSAKASFSRRGQLARPGNPQAKRTKRGVRVFAAAGPVEWEVGRVG